MQPHEELLELRRKTLHLIIGVVVAALLWVRWVDGIFLLSLAFLTLGVCLFIKENAERHVPLLKRALHVFEREHQIESFPRKSAIFFFFGCATAALLFPRDVAVAAIIILAFGDTISNLVGHHFGRIKTPFHPIKNIEGPIAAIIISSLIASFFIDLRVAFAGSLFAMILEFPDIKIFGYRLDDNLIIPISSGFFMVIAQYFL
jgi:dolichol kinase